MQRFSFSSPSWVLLGALGCGASPGGAADAASDAAYGHRSMDAGSAGDTAADVKTPWNRMTPHDGIVLGAPHIRAIYIGTQGGDLSPSYDAYISWLVTSTDWWSIMAQYGVGYGTLDGSTIIDTTTFFPSGMVQNGFVDYDALAQRLAQVIHAQDDAGLPTIPKADAYVLFMPSGVNVWLGGQDGATCQSVYGYHDYDGQEPYAVIPPCRMHLSVAHELAEMVTDPLPFQGWYSEADINPAGGEIADLCNWLTYASGQQVTSLWSNKDGDCEPP